MPDKQFDFTKAMEQASNLRASGAIYNLQDGSRLWGKYLKAARKAYVESPPVLEHYSNPNKNLTIPFKELQGVVTLRDGNKQVSQAVFSGKKSDVFLYNTMAKGLNINPRRDAITNSSVVIPTVNHTPTADGRSFTFWHETGHTLDQLGYPGIKRMDYMDIEDEKLRNRLQRTNDDQILFEQESVADAYGETKSGVRSELPVANRQSVTRIKRRFGNVFKRIESKMYPETFAGKVNNFNLGAKLGYMDPEALRVAGTAIGNSIAAVETQDPSGLSMPLEKALYAAGTMLTRKPEYIPEYYWSAAGQSSASRMFPREQVAMSLMKNDMARQ